MSIGDWFLILWALVVGFYVYLCGDSPMALWVQTEWLKYKTGYYKDW